MSASPHLRPADLGVMAISMKKTQRDDMTCSRSHGTLEVEPRARVPKTLCFSCHSPCQGMAGGESKESK